MQSTAVGVRSAEVDLISELRYRRWARENYVPAAQRDMNWHPVVLDEMQRKDAELLELLEAPRA